MNLKKLAFALPVLVITLLSSAAHAKDHPCSDNPADHEAVVKTVQIMYTAAINDDMNIFHTIAAPDFYAFDNGKRYDGDALMNLVQEYHAKGVIFSWSVTDPTVHSTCDNAWITYTNVGSIKDEAGNVTQMQWLESAVLQKEDGHWLIRFFHSTRVPQVATQK